MDDPQKTSQDRPVKKKTPIWLMALIVVVVSGILGILAQGLRNSGSGPLAVGQPLPDFSFTTFGNQTFGPDELKGKVVVLNFWASWCQPCEQEAAALESAWKKYQTSGKVVFLGIDYMDTQSEAQKFLDTHGVTYPNGPDLRSTISNKFRLLGVPETFIFDRRGLLAYYKYGPFLSVNEITIAIDPLIN